MILLRAVAAALVLAASVGTGGARAVVPGDPLASSWTYAAASLPEAWDVATGSEDVVIAVVDSGVEASHPDLVGAVVPGHDFVDQDADAADVNGHGTAVAGIAAARANNGLGAAGVCWRCRIMPLRVLRPDGFAQLNTIAGAIDYAVEHGAAVVNVSLYGESRNGALEAAVRRARRSGVLVVAAAGNEGRATPEYPAAYEDALSVGATDESGALATYSSRGQWVKLAAPGCTPTTLLGGGYGAGCGTSGASPLVAGIVGLLRARAPLATATQIEAALAGSARRVADVRFGAVDAFAAVQRLGIPGPTLEPAIEGAALPGRALTAHSGVWAGAALDVSYGWERCHADTCAAAADGRTYVVQPGDGGFRLRVTLTAPGAEPASAVTTVVPTLPAVRAAPSISGRPRVGATLRGRLGTWSGPPTAFEVRWLRCLDAACHGATTASRARSYRVRRADRGRRLVFEVTAVNELGRRTASSRPTPRVR